MILTNLIISSLFAFELEASDPRLLQNDVFLEQRTAPEKMLFLSDEDISKTIDYVQAFNLVYQDIYVYTKPALNKEYSINGQNYTAGELNPVANMFFKNNLWDLAFISAGIFNYFMFNNEYLSTAYSIALDILEIWAISTRQSTTTRQISVNAIIYEKMF